MLTALLAASTLAPAGLNLLVFSKTAGFRHDSIETAQEALRKEGAARGWRMTVTEDAAWFDAAKLKGFNAVVFLMTTGDVLNDAQESAFKRFVEGGGGFVGIHSAADTEYGWNWYGELVGAYFKSHPRIQQGVVRVEDKKHPSTAFLPENWTRTDEWYCYRANPRGKVNVLASLDESSYQGGTMGGDHPIAWHRTMGKGRSWYTGGGHTKESYAEPLFMQHVVTGIEWASKAPQKSESGWISLFNGKNLDGWTPKIKGYPLGVNYANTFRVENGAIKVAYDGYEGPYNDRFGHLFYKSPFSHYILRMEYRFTGEQVQGGPGWAWRNSGVMVHGQDPKTMRVDQDFPVSCEVQFLGGPAQGDRTTGNVCTPGTHLVMDGKLVTRHCTDAKSPTYRGDQWVSLELEVRGHGLVIHRINGQEVLRYEQVQLDPNDADAKNLIKDGNVKLQGGTISLQSESHPIEFRNIRLKKLAP